MADEDRRHDAETRSRLDALTESWEEAVKRLDARYRLVARIVTAAMVLSLASLTGQAWLLWRTSQDSDRQREALCALRLERERGVTAGERFLRLHPHGTSDFSVKDIQSGIATQRTTVTALSGIRCPDQPPTPTATPTPTR